MQAALCNQKRNSDTSGKSLKSEFIKGGPSSILDKGKTSAMNFEQELAKIPMTTPSKNSDSSSEKKKYGVDNKTPPSLLSSVFVQKMGNFWV